MLFAKKIPYQITVLKLTRREVVVPAAGGPDSEFIFPASRSDYDVANEKMLLDTEVSLSDDEDIWIVPRICLYDEGAFSNVDAQRLEVFVRCMPEAVRIAPAAGDRRRAAPRDVRLRILEENPFLDPEDLGLGGRGRTAAPRPRGGAVGGEVGSDMEDDVAELNSDSDWDELDIEHELVDIAAELSEARAGIAASEGEDGYFYVMVRGGKWTLEHKGVVADACAGKARGGLPVSWCKYFKYPTMASASFQKYTRDRALELSREFCRRSTYFFRLWLDSGLSYEVFRYTQAHVDAYVRHPDWAAFMTDVPAGSTSHKRAVKLDALVPKIG